MTDVAVDSRLSVGALIAAILLPPLGVFLARGLRPVFWLDVLLTLLGWLPGVLFALFALIRPSALGRLAD
jgi:uncharacterized membrane protein YqaE (UPF0057 family)